MSASSARKDAKQLRASGDGKWGMHVVNPVDSIDLSEVRRQWYNTLMDKTKVINNYLMFLVSNVYLTETFPRYLKFTNPSHVCSG